MREVVRRTLRARRRGFLGWAGGAAAVATLAIALYPTIHRGSAELGALLEQMPSGLLSLFNVDPDIFTTARGYLETQLYGFLGPILVIAYAVLLGAGATAGEEETGTADLLLTAPVSRTGVLLGKALGIAGLLAGVVATFATALVLGDPAAGLAIPVAGIVGIHLSLFLLGVFFGALALLLGAATGRRRFAAAGAGGVAMLTFLLHGLAPLVPGLAWLRGWTPVAWYLRGEPLRSGPSMWELPLLAGAALGTAAAVAAFGRRDLGVFTPPRRLLRSWRRLRRSSRRASRRAPRRIYGEALWERRASLGWWAGGIATLTALVVAFYPSIRRTDGEALRALVAAYPREILAIFGVTDPASVLTGPGFVSSRIHGSIGLLALVAFAIGFGAAALAGEERRGTADLLWTAPVSRDRVVLEQAAALLTAVGIVAAAIAAVVAVGNPLAGLEVSGEGLLAGSLGMALLAFLHGAVALTVGAATGRPGPAQGAAVAAALAGYLLNGFGSFVTWLEPFRVLSPFAWYQGGTNPLSQHLGWEQPALLGVGLLLVGIAVPLFRNREVGT